MNTNPNSFQIQLFYFDNTCINNLNLIRTQLNLEKLPCNTCKSLKNITYSIFSPSPAFNSCDNLYDTESHKYLENLNVIRKQLNLTVIQQNNNSNTKEVLFTKKLELFDEKNVQILHTSIPPKKKRRIQTEDINYNVSKKLTQKNSIKFASSKSQTDSGLETSNFYSPGHERINNGLNATFSKSTNTLCSNLTTSLEFCSLNVPIQNVFENKNNLHRSVNDNNIPVHLCSSLTEPRKSLYKYNFLPIAYITNTKTSLHKKKITFTKNEKKLHQSKIKEETCSLHSMEHWQREDINDENILDVLECSDQKQNWCYNLFRWCFHTQKKPTL